MFEFTRLAIEYNSSCWENSTKMYTIRICHIQDLILCFRILYILAFIYCCNFVKYFKNYNYNNWRNVNQASNVFKVDRKDIRNWVKSEELIKKQKRTSRSTRHGKVVFPVMEKELYKRFIGTSKESGSRDWLMKQAKWIMSKTNPEHVGTFKMSDRWFAGFCQRNKISLGRKTHASPKNPEQLWKSISKLRANTLKEKRWGTCTSRDLVNMG